MAHFFSERLLRPFRQANPPASSVENTSSNSNTRGNAVTQKQEAAEDPASSMFTYFDYSHVFDTILSPFTNHSAELVNGSAMEVDQQPPTRGPTSTKKKPSTKNRPKEMHGSISSEASRADQKLVQILQKRLNDVSIGFQDMKKHCQKLSNNNQRLENQLSRAQAQNQEMEEHCLQLFDDKQRLENQLSRALARNQDTMAKLERLQDAKACLIRQNDDLKLKYTKKVESYKELDRNYMNLVRPLQVSGDDYSTIYSRLMHIRVSIENLVQKARGEGSANLNKEAAIEHFRGSKLLEGFPVEESLLESYHLNLYMESAIMTGLIERLFNRALACIFDQSEEFEKISRWVDKRDNKIAVRWRQQLCVLVARDSDAMKCRKEGEVNEAATVLLNLVTKVYPNVDMSTKIKELCYHAFDLSFAMFGMESIIQPASTPLGVPFDDTTMITPQKSNPTGIVSLVIFPAFRDKAAFYITPKSLNCEYYNSSDHDIRQTGSCPILDAEKAIETPKTTYCIYCQKQGHDFGEGDLCGKDIDEAFAKFVAMQYGYRQEKGHDTNKGHQNNAKSNS
ncbi:hypothetical protein BGX26_011842 [Mortierella sp. AD094]|nr:hypothetical protein BGX26_011842 [Mortierella sp. AD094]